LQTKQLEIAKKEICSQNITSKGLKKLHFKLECSYLCEKLRFFLVALLFLGHEHLVRPGFLRLFEIFVQFRLGVPLLERGRGDRELLLVSRRVARLGQIEERGLFASSPREAFQIRFETFYSLLESSIAAVVAGEAVERFRADRGFRRQFVRFREP